MRAIARNKKNLIVLCTSNTFHPVPLGESKWSSAPGLESAVYVLAVIVAQYCFRMKCKPKFPVLESLEREVKSMPFLQDKEIQHHFIRLYRAIKDLIEEKIKLDELSELALFQPTFINIWDIGVNRVLYDNLSSVCSQSKRLVMVICLDLERDVAQLNTPPDMMCKESYSQRGDSKLVMRVQSRLHYILLLAGVKRWFGRQLPNPEAPEAIFLGFHTQEFASLNGGKKLQETIDLLQRSILAEAEKMNITNVINPKILSFCTDATCAADELNMLKMSIETLVHAQPDSSTVFQARGMFLRSLLYGDDKPMLVTRSAISSLAKKCGIYFDKELENFLANCRDTGSLLFYPRSANHFLYDHITLDLVKPLALLDRLYYLRIYIASKAIEPMTEEQLEQYRYGIISKHLAMKVFKNNSTIDLFMHYLSNSQVCTNISATGHEEKYFFPSIRTLADESSADDNSLFVRYSSHLWHSSCLILYIKLLENFFQVPSEALVSYTEHYNTVLFKIYLNSSQATDVLVIYNLKKPFIEVRINDLQKSLHLDLCSRFVQLSHKVFQYLSDYLQNQKFELCIKCPENNDHLACFFLTYHQNVVYCKECGKSVKITDNRLSWLSAE